MCLLKYIFDVQPVKSRRDTSFPSRRSRSRVPEDSSLELSTSTYTSSQVSKESQVSTSSTSSLAGLKDMLSDGAHIFSYKDISRATDHFSSSKKVGTSVFRGMIHNMDVAIVVDKKGAIHTDFTAEIKNLCSVHHSNLVKMIGGCMSGDQVYLVYEFIAGGNLRQYLHSSISPGFSALPSWTGRLQVALDVAKGLEYIHDHTHTPFVHKYIKSSNILVDSELHVRIANFGVARIRGEFATDSGAGVAEAHTSSSGEISEIRGQETPKRSLRSTARSRSIKITGTHGYMAPEYVSAGLVTPKLDVFSFGVILLEILSGQEAVKLQPLTRTNSYQKTLLPEVIGAIFADSHPKSRLRTWMDPLLRDSFPLDCAFRTAQLAKSCVEPDPQLRPPMRNVAMTLLQILIASQAWEENMLASKNLQITNTIEAR